MILSETEFADRRLATLDGLFRRAGVRHPEAVALADPPNCADVAGGAPRTLSYAEADRAISGVAARLRDLGLLTDSIVAIQLGNTVESVVALLGVMRAGMIAAPVPLLWRQREMVEALGPLGPKAVITAGRIGGYAHANNAMQVAADLFPVRYVCAFGSDLPDGVVPLDDVFDATPVDLAGAARIEQPAAHVAVVTFDVTAKGYVAVARSHAELIAGGLAVSLEVGLPQDSTILSTIPVASFAGLSAALLPWLMCGGTLHLHHGFAADAFAAQRLVAHGGALVLPGPVLTPLFEAGQLDGANHILALWRAPERLAGSAPWQGQAKLFDVVSFGEAGVCASARNDAGLPAAIPLGAVGAPRAAADAMTLLETVRTKAGTIALRGAMVPKAAFPPGAEHGGGAFLAPDEDGFVDTGFTCRLDRAAQALTVTGAPGGLATVGGYSFRPSELDVGVARIDPQATIMAVPDALLGQRLAGRGRERTPAFLQAVGFNALVAGAFRPRKAADAA